MAILDDDSKSLQNKTGKIAEDIKILQQCGQMDSIDKFIWQAPTIGAFMVSLSGKGKPLTYGDLLHVIDSVRKTTFYQQVRLAIATNTPPQGVVEENDEAIQEAASYTFQSFQTLDNCLAAARKSKKKVLLYFSAETGVNCRMMEKKVFTNEEVKSELSKSYDSYVLIADDNTPTKGEFKSVGDYVIAIQEKRFNANAQPYFVILDSSGKTIGKSGGYMSEPEAFLQFLRQ